MDETQTPGCIPDEDGEFLAVVKEGRKVLQSQEFQLDDWSWARELDDDGTFIFSYLLHDFRDQTLTLARFEEAVYTLGMLLHRLLPAADQSGLSRIGEFQVIFTLYEKLKQTEMTWDACEEFVSDQIQRMHRHN